MLAHGAHRVLTCCSVRMQEEKAFKMFFHKVKFDCAAVKITVQEAHTLWLIKEQAADDHFVGIYMRDVASLKT